MHSHASFTDLDLAQQTAGLYPTHPQLNCFLCRNTPCFMPNHFLLHVLNGEQYLDYDATDCGNLIGQSEVV